MEGRGEGVFRPTTCLQYNASHHPKTDFFQEKTPITIQIIFDTYKKLMFFRLLYS